MVCHSSLRIGGGVLSQVASGAVARLKLKREAGAHWSTANRMDALTKRDVIDNKASTIFGTEACRGQAPYAGNTWRRNTRRLSVQSASFS